MSQNIMGSLRRGNLAADYADDADLALHLSIYLRLSAFSAASAAKNRWLVDVSRLFRRPL